MNKTILRFGFLSGVVSVVLMAATVPFIRSIRHEPADVLGYTSIVLSALLVFFGIRSYRETTGEGRITFARGFAVGVLITLISCVCLVVAFQLMYFALVPDFGEKFAACMVERARSAGSTDQQIVETARQAQQFKQLYDNPATNAALTFAMSFPVGLAATIASAAILSRRPGHAAVHSGDAR
jgi:F0F1-type ATP synthase assembly protein I